MLDEDYNRGAYFIFLVAQRIQTLSSSIIGMNESFFHDSALHLTLYFYLVQLGSWMDYSCAKVLNHIARWNLWVRIDIIHIETLVCSKLTSKDWLFLLDWKEWKSRTLTQVIWSFPELIVLPHGFFSFFFKLWKYDNTFTGDLKNTKKKVHIVPLYIAIIF